MEITPEVATILAGAIKMVGAGIAMIGAMGAGLGVGMSAFGGVTGIARNPDAAGEIQTNMILGIVFTEAIAIYCLVVSMLIIFVG